jgi:hypothetical protein
MSKEQSQKGYPPKNTALRRRDTGMNGLSLDSSEKIPQKPETVRRRNLNYAGYGGIKQR